MASEALQNQALLDQMFARSVAPVAQALEVQRQRAAAQQDWERNMAQRERELNMEQTFRAQQHRETLAAQEKLALAQQAAIGARETAQFNQRLDAEKMKTIWDSKLLTPEEKEKANSDPAFRDKKLAELTKLQKDKNLKAFSTLDRESQAVTKELIGAMINSSSQLGPKEREAAVNEWLQTQPAEVKAKIMKSVMANGGSLDIISPENLTKILKTGWVGSGFGGVSEDQKLEAIFGLGAALNLAATKSGKTPPELGLAMSRYQDIVGRAAEYQKTNSGDWFEYLDSKKAEGDARGKEVMDTMVKETPLEQPNAFISAPRAVAPESLGPSGKGWWNQPMPVPYQDPNAVPAADPSMLSSWVNGIGQAWGFGR